MIRFEVRGQVMELPVEQDSASVLQLIKRRRVRGSHLVSGSQMGGGGEAELEGEQVGAVCRKNKDRYVARIGVTGAPPWSQAWGWGSAGERLVAGSLPTGPGRAQPEIGDVGPPSSRLTTRRKVHEGPVQCGLGSSRGGGPRRPNPWTKTLAIGTWNVTSLGGKEPELCAGG
ncbi:hypothetical protein L3Q82_020142 [Scortum barcoo]|uniref:Uncharacterized protein n=1 Tax=Scortum barcoo TaxID=214431 RepID=A0ACB8VAL0_9TELE|nr:hypothetical protein L3Q82_020142 [Scortum barcoo]